MNAIIGGFVAIVGALFLLLAGIGMIRMPDVYNRMQTGTKATTLGTILFILGVGIAQPEWLPKALLIIGFVVVTNPISSHVLARAAHIGKVALSRRSVRDDLADSTGAES
ncbi:MAG TPA: monovalent cation/H(+) antiporter subunit G [Spirochaetia bacterium]|nr:monovalent cation/H(+) antiporter subunit G [Spirochaetia bacterium]